MTTPQPKTPVIDPEFQALISPLAAEEREQLEANLVAEGCRDPLVTWRGILIDGHNRLEICTRRGIRYCTVEIELTARERVLLWIEENQLGRRNLPDAQRAAISVSVRERKKKLNLIERATKAGKAGGRGREKNSLRDTSTLKLSDRDNRSDVQAAKAAGVSERMIRTVEEIKKKSDEAYQKIRSGEKTLPEAKHDLRVAERESRIREAHRIAVSMPPSDRYTLHHCALSEAPLDADSVDVIITDPPYGREYLPAFAELRALAARCLKPGGSLLVMSGQSYLPDVIDALRGAEGLAWHWIVAYVCAGQAPRMWQRQVTPMWKPVLWFVKGKYQGDCVVDVITSNQNDKRFHEWGQSESGMAALVERFSLPGQTILDPFVGGGTTGAVALKLERRFIGIDRDQSAIETTKARLSA